LKKARQLATQRLQQIQYTPLDGVIDGDKYILGPHDIIRIQVWAAVTIDEMAEVTPDGMIVIPGYGAVEVGGISWNQAKQKLTETIHQVYNPKNFSITLASVRIFWVNITGAVNLPGSYQLGATQRLWDLVQLAGGADGIADLSNITIYRKTGETLSVDITPYFSQGEISANPYLFGGDVVFLPPVSSQTGMIQVYGTGIRNGYYGLNGDETIQQLAQRLRVFTQHSDFSNVQILRGDDIISVNLMTENPTLLDGDMVIFPTHLDSIIVGGLVVQGGAYPYYPEFSTYAYIAMAGGPTDKGSENRISIFRNGERIKLKPGDILRPGDVIIVHHSTFDRVKDFFEMVARVVSSSITIYYLIDRLTR